MSVIFKTSPLKHCEYDLEDTTLVLHEFGADVFYRHVLSVDGLLAYEKLKGEDGESESVDDQAEAVISSVEKAKQMHQALQNTCESRLLQIACSLAPGYPGVSILELRDELSVNLNKTHLKNIAEIVDDLNGIQVGKQGDQTGDLSAD